MNKKIAVWPIKKLAQVFDSNYLFWKSVCLKDPLQNIYWIFLVKPGVFQTLTSYVGHTVGEHEQVIMAYHKIDKFYDVCYLV